MCDDDIRKPSRELTDKERQLLALDFGAMLVRSFAFAVVAAAIGISGSLILQPAAAPTAVAATTQALD